jgi:hypothetical protein
MQQFDNPADSRTLAPAIVVEATGPEGLPAEVARATVPPRLRASA